MIKLTKYDINFKLVDCAMDIIKVKKMLFLKYLKLFKNT